MFMVPVPGGARRGIGDILFYIVEPFRMTQVFVARSFFQERRRSLTNVPVVIDQVMKARLSDRPPAVITVFVLRMLHRDDKVERTMRKRALASSYYS